MAKVTKLGLSHVSKRQQRLIETAPEVDAA
jgi:hypothetical protein